MQCVSVTARKLLRSSMSIVMGWSMNAVEDRLTSGETEASWLCQVM